MTELPKSLPFLAAHRSDVKYVRHYQVVDRATGVPIDAPIAWADADLGVYARYLVVEPKPGEPPTVGRGWIRRAGPGSRPLKTLVYADIAIVLRPTLNAK